MVNRKLIILAVLLSFITTISVYFYLEKASKKAKGGAYTQVVVAKNDIPSKTTVTSEMVELKEVPQDFAHPEALLKKEEVVGKITGGTIFAGEQLLRKKVVKEGDDSKGLAFKVPKGKRAVSVPINDVSGVAGLVKPGDRVDVFGTLDIDGKVVGRVTQTSLVLQNIEILAVNRNLQEEGTNETGNERQQTVTLAVKPEEAPPLILVTEKGNIRLSLRAPTDLEIKNVPTHRLSNFLKEGE